MYRVSPFNYMVDGMLATGLANTKVVCSSIEFSTLDPPPDQTCGQFMNTYIKDHGGYLADQDSTQNCQFCSANETNAVLLTLNSDYSHRWRNFGILWVFIGFNVITALLLYWFARVPKKQKVLDSPPTGLASRVQTRVSESAAVRAEMSKKEGERDVYPAGESTSNDEKIQTVEEDRISADFVTPFENKSDLYQSIIKDERKENAGM